MKTTKQQFKQFKEECKKWQDKFELNDWKIYYQHVSYDGGYAQIHKNSNNRVATIFFNGELENKEEYNNLNIKEIAKHEMIHLMLARLSEIGVARFISEDETIEAEEELVQKLINII